MSSANALNLNQSQNLLFGKELTLSKTTNFRLFQTKRVCRWQFQIGWKWQKVLQMGWKHCGKKEKLLVMINFSFSHSVYKRLVLRTHENQGLLGKGLKKGPFTWPDASLYPYRVISTTWLVLASKDGSQDSVMEVVLVEYHAIFEVVASAVTCLEPGIRPGKTGK